jgi:putative endonuclease
MRGPKLGKGGFVYMMGNAAHTVIYTGVTADIEARAWQHKHGQGGQFTALYKCTELLWYEMHDRIEDAIQRESQIKNWKRAWKVELIKSMNPEVVDLAADWFDRQDVSHRGDSGSSPE